MTEPAEPAEQAADETPTTPAPAGKRSLRLPLVIGIAVAVVAAGVAGFLLFRGGPAVAGECVSVSGADEDAKVTTADCADKSATFKVASRIGSDCPPGAYRQVRDGSEYLCLQPNFREGNCYAADDENSGFKLADCTEPEVIRIDKVIEGTSDTAECPDGSGLPFAEPPTVYCVRIVT